MPVWSERRRYIVDIVLHRIPREHECVYSGFLVGCRGTAETRNEVASDQQAARAGGPQSSRAGTISNAKSPPRASLSGQMVEARRPVPEKHAGRMEESDMPTIRVTVLRDGDPVSGHRVTLGFSEGMSDPEYTYADGIAEFNVEYGQEGDVFVDGRNVASWGSYSTTDITVEL